MKAFVTGATGFLGSHVARVLGEQGADLRLLVRSTSNLRNLEGIKAETATGDLRDSSSLEKGMSGCDTVFHVAADYRLWVRDPAEMYRSNVDGTKAILDAARKHGVAVVFEDDATYPEFAELTSTFVYARLRRSAATCATGYSVPSLKKWALRAQAWAKPRRDVFIYFINGAKERAPAAAQKLISML